MPPLHLSVDKIPMNTARPNILVLLFQKWAQKWAARVTGHFRKATQRNRKTKINRKINLKEIGYRKQEKISIICVLGKIQDSVLSIRQKQLAIKKKGKWN